MVGGPQASPSPHRYNGDGDGNERMKSGAHLGRPLGISIACGDKNE